MSRTVFRFTASGVFGFGTWCSLTSSKEVEARSKQSSGSQVWPPCHSLEQPVGDRSKQLSASLRSAWGSFRLEEILPINYNTAKFVFSFSDPNSKYDLPVSSTVEIKLKADNGKHVSRIYTPLTSQGSRGGFEIVSRVYEHGQFTPFLHSLKEGSEIMGRFSATSFEGREINNLTHIGCITCGPGVAPALQICRHALECGTKLPLVTLLYSNKTQSDILLKNELDQLQAKYPANFKVVYLLKYPPVGWEGEVGLITPQLLLRTMPPPGRFLSQSSATGIYLSCPDKLMKVLDGRFMFPKSNFSDVGELAYPHSTARYTAEKKKGFLHRMGYTDDELHRHPCR